MGNLQEELQKKVIKGANDNTVNKAEGENNMIKFFHNGILNADLISNKAKDWAVEFYKEKLSSAQIRKFYGEVLSIEEKLKSLNNFELVKPQILMLKSKAAYAANRNNRKIPDKFKGWIFRMVDSINNEKDFKAFKLVFEAVVGYFYGEGVK